MLIYIFNEIKIVLLIITNEADIHPNPVIDILNKKGLPFFRFNTDKILADYDVLYEISNKKTFFEIKYKNYEKSITSDQITCVWERRPMEPLATYDHYEDEKIKKIILDEADGFIKFFRYSLTNVYWIGHPIIERQAGSKILQKIVAKNIGFKIPDTVFSNQFSSIKIFENKNVAVKPIYSFDIESKGGSLVFYTSKKTHNDLLSLGENSFRNNINFIEEYKDKDYELRVTAVDGKCYTAKIESQKLDKDKGAVDWRQGYDHGITFKKTIIPKEIELKCLLFLKHFNLNFGCFDFIVDLNGNYTFLECNTNGQWMWLEEEAKLPISAAIAKAFENEIKSKR
jgi:glutathione synthase/RimK-type ligase-like ATP-grasp enzyme|tara:strand:+ start:311 stop:1333 length:1023 start_codon:yes stop_codon:yes gene_type:complete